MLCYKMVETFPILITLFSLGQAILVDDKFLINYVEYFNNVFFNKSANLTEECESSINGSNFLETKMFDASSKIPAGIFETGTEDLGNFDECYEYTSTSSGKMFYGKYCIGEMDIEYSEPPEYLHIFHQLHEERPKLTSAFCLPSTCTIHDFETLYHQHNFSEVRCFSIADNGGYSVWIILTISILSLMFIVVSMATIYDYLTDAKRKNLFKQISVINSWRTLFSTETRETEFTSLYGLRCITMSWIILHHTYIYYHIGGLNNRSVVFETLLQPKNLYIAYGSWSVSTFFTIGSVLTSYNFLKHYEKKNFSATWNCIRRYVRLTPPLAVMVLVNASLYEIGSGPLWYKMQFEIAKPCQQYWWSALLYLQNYINPTTECVTQAWYLSVDMQCYIIFSYLLVILSKRKRLMVPVLLALLAISPIVVFFVLYNNSILATFFSNIDLQDSLYYKPTHVRFGAYVAGLLIGIFLHEINSKHIVMPKKLSFVIIFCLAMVYGGIFIVGYLVLEDFLGYALMMASKEILWSGGIGLLIFMCESGNADFIKSFLSLSFFKILTRLTYGMYLVSMTITIIRITSSRVIQEFSLYHLYQKFFSDFVTSLICSFLLYIFIEMPFAHIGSYILGRVRGYMKPGCCRNDMTNTPSLTHILERNEERSA